MDRCPIAQNQESPWVPVDTFSHNQVDYPHLKTKTHQESPIGGILALDAPRLARFSPGFAAA